MRSETIPKTIKRWLDKNKGKIESVEMEFDEFGGVNSPYSIWVYFNKGWINGSEQTHFIHEYDVKGFMCATEYVSRCECAECLHE